MIWQWPSERIPQRVVFISDLHLFSGRCNVEEHQLAIEQAVDWSELCVWGGDLFDFRWSRLSNEATTVDRAIGWLEDWCERYPETSFAFLQGNHDVHASFANRLQAWARDTPQFVSGLECLRIGDTLMLHGDVIEGNGSSEAFWEYRNRWSGRPPASRVQHRAYDVAIAARLHRAVATAAHSNRRTCLRLLRWMHAQPEAAVAGVSRVVFGHTHRMMSGRRVRGVQFFNGGATIRHVPFSPVALDSFHPPSPSGSASGC